MAQVAVSKDDVIIGSNIRRIREEHNHTQVFLAAEINYSRNHLCAVENGRKPAGYPMLVRLAEYYQKTLDYFYHGTSSQIAMNRRAKIMSVMASELSDHAIDCAENTIMTLWSIEHNDDAEKRYEEIGAMIDAFSINE